MNDINNVEGLSTLGDKRGGRSRSLGGISGHAHAGNQRT